MLRLRVKTFSNLLGVTTGDIAREFGVSKRILNEWMFDPDTIPEDKREEVADYFGIPFEKFAEPVFVEVPMESVSKTINLIQGVEGLDEETSSQLANIVEELKEVLISNQKRLGMV